MLQWIQGEVDSTDQLSLIQGRRGPQKDKPPAPQTLPLRHYLSMVRTQKHRETLTSLLMSTHLFLKIAVEVLWWGDHLQKREDLMKDLQLALSLNLQMKSFKFSTLSPCFGWLPVRGIDVLFLSLVTYMCCLSSTARRGTGCVSSARAICIGQERWST